MHAQPYAVFIARNGSWHPHAEFGGPISARQERDYLVNMLGLVAQVFVRSPASHPVARGGVA